MIGKRHAWKLLFGMLVFYMVIFGPIGVSAKSKGSKTDFLKANSLNKAALDKLNLQGYDKLMIVAHPDDETLWGGAHLAEGKYLVVCLTNGNNKRRKNEFQAAVKAFGDKGIILCYPDLTNRRRDNWNSCRTAIKKDVQTLLGYKNWKEIVTHNPKGEYGHIHHKMTNSIVTKAVKAAGKTDRLYYFGKYYKKGSIPKRARKVSKNALNKKNAVCRKYVSQKRSINAFGHMNPYENWIPAVRWK